MKFDLNRVTVIGHLGKDPEIRHTQDGKRIASFSLATGQSYQDRNGGEERSYTQWHRIVITADGLAGVAEKYLRKGSKVFLEGQLEYRTYKDKLERDVTVSEIVLRPGMRHTLQIIGGFKNDQGETAEPSGEDWSAMLDDNLPDYGA